jgi:hypothetical protein
VERQAALALEEAHRIAAGGWSSSSSARSASHAAEHADAGGGCRPKPHQRQPGDRLAVELATERCGNAWSRPDPLCGPDARPASRRDTAASSEAGHRLAGDPAQQQQTLQVISSSSGALGHGDGRDGQGTGAGQQRNDDERVG